jgi:hypothetical protein
MKSAFRALALRAHYLTKQNITGPELAKRLKLLEPRPDGLGLYDVDRARKLAEMGANIEAVEGCRLTPIDRLVLKTIVRMVARRFEEGGSWIKVRDIDRVAGKRSGWCNRSISRLTLQVNLIEFTPGQHARGQQHIRLSRAGWAFAWSTGLLKPSWKVPT